MTSAAGATAQSIGRTLSRLGMIQRPTDDAARGTRESIRSVIAESAAPITIEAICSATGLHANTVRPHLDVLLATGSIAREQGERRGRGRPPWLYRAVEAPRERERRRLATALKRQLQEADSTDLAELAGQRWAEQQLPGPADSVDEAVEHAARSLAAIGFDVAVPPTKDRIDLMSCPYADLIAERPVICDIHAALLARLLADSGQDVQLDRLDVYPRPGVCTAFLRRDDQPPLRSIPGSSA